MIKVFAKNFKNNETFGFYDDDSYHILNVLRLSLKDQIICIYENNKYLCEIVSISPLLAKALSVIETKSEINYQLDVYQAVIKPKNMELIIQKLTELNVNNLYPVMFERSQANNINNHSLNRQEMIIKSASKQSGRFDFLELKSQINFNEMLKQFESNQYDLIIVPYENESENYLIPSDLDHKSKVAIVIGPEGGFSKSEIQRLIESKNINIKLVTLTKTILRSETACLYTVSLTQNYLLMKGK